LLRVGADGGADGQWTALVAQGLTGLAIPERADGAGLGAVETLLVMENLGQLASLAPYLSRAVLPSAFLTALGSATADALLRDLASAERAILVGGLGPDTPPLRASGDRLSGEVLILDGECADTFVLVADGSDSQAFVLRADAPGVTVTPLGRLDGGRMARVTLDSAAAELLAQGEIVTRAADQALAWGNAALCGEAAGLMRALVDMTVDYLKARRQFGAALSSFQALQHRLVDMRLHQELSRSMAAAAAMAIDSGEALRRDRVVAAAKVQICLSGRRIAEEAIQLHGAIGMTEELPVGRHAKRLLVIEQSLGNRFDHLERFRMLGTA
jgi:alkylation response protein AidB-like acyl-CoA dehydrogenase